MTDTEGNIRVSSVPGSGKTFVLTYRIAYLIAEFVDLRNSCGLAKAVSDKYAGGYFFLKNIAAVREDGRHARVHAACVVFQGNLADFHSRHIGHGIEFAGGQDADMDAVTADSVVGHLDSSSSRLMV